MKGREFWIDEFMGEAWKDLPTIVDDKCIRVIEYSAYEALEEKHRMQLAGIMTASMCNTKKSMAEQLITKDNPYWTVAYQDVIEAVTREMVLIEKLSVAVLENTKLKEEIARLRK